MAFYQPHLADAIQDYLIQAFQLVLHDHMGHFLQDGEKGCFVPFFLKSTAFVWPNLIR